ncbi:LOW QUALITY PROTEIN: GTPase RhebL1 [Acridotheres tristis]
MVVVGKVEFHDWAEDEYTILPHSFIIGIHGYILVYLVTSLWSFQVVQTLHNKLYKSRGKTRMPVVLVGHKADLALLREEGLWGFRLCVQPRAHPACPLLFCCVLSWEARTDEGRKLVESWGAIFLSSAKESQVWGAEPTWHCEQGSQCAGTVPLSSGDHGNLHETY